MKVKLYYFILPFLLFFTASCAPLTPSKNAFKEHSSGASEKPQAVFSQIPDGDNEKLITQPHAFGRNKTAKQSGFKKQPLDLAEKFETESISKGHFIDTALELCETAQEFWQKGELENALDALDQAYELIIQVDTYDNPFLTQQKDDLRFMISKRILEIYASRNIVVNGKYKEIPLTINEHVQREINLFTTGGERSFFIESYKRSGLYRPMILEYLKNAGLPEELSWLPLIESGFKVNALSSARALGLWQFIPSTGYKFGLKRDYYVDERLDFEKSTLAAIAYMKELHQIFGDWSTVLAAYNCGEGRVLRVIRTQNVNYLDNFWDLYTRLPRETARYVPRFIATLHVINNLEKYGMDSIEPYEPLDYETVILNREAHLRAVAQTMDISENKLKSLNPELRNNTLPGEEYTLRVPIGKSQMLMAKIDDIPAYSSQPAVRQGSTTTVRHHRVRRGENISLIAKRYGVSTQAIANANGLNRNYLIVTGQTLTIPPPGSTVSGRTHKTSSSKQIINHEVRAGDSLWVLARRYGTTTKMIQELNGLKDSKLYIGQMLKIANSSHSTASRSKYSVNRGDTPFSIAKRHNMSVNRFLELNNLHTNSKIYPGQTFYLE